MTPVSRPSLIVHFLLVVVGLHQVKYSRIDINQLPQDGCNAFPYAGALQVVDHQRHASASLVEQGPLAPHALFTIMHSMIRG